MRGRGFSGGIGSGKRRGRAKTPRSPSRAAPDPGPPRCHHPQSLEAPGQARGGLELEGGETLWTVDPLPQHRATLAIRSGRIRRSGWKVIGGAEGDRTPDLIIANDTLSQLSYCPAPRLMWGKERGLSRRGRGDADFSAAGQVRATYSAADDLTRIHVSIDADVAAEMTILLNGNHLLDSGNFLL